MEPKRRLLTAAALGGGLLLVYGPGAIRWVELKTQIARLESEIAALKSQNERLIQEARRLREDPAYAEAVARREMGFVRPGETVIKLRKKESSSKSPP